MSEEEASFGIVGVSIRFRELVMNTVVTSPVVNGALVGDGIAKHKEGSEEKVSFVRAMRPETVYSHCDTKATEQWGEKDAPLEHSRRPHQRRGKQ